jgi:hypothetical protein
MAISATVIPLRPSFGRRTQKLSGRILGRNSETVRSYSGPKRCFSFRVRCFCMTNHAVTPITRAIMRTATMTVLAGIIVMKNISCCWPIRRAPPWFRIDADLGTLLGFEQSLVQNPARRSQLLPETGVGNNPLAGVKTVFDQRRRLCFNRAHCRRIGRCDPTPVVTRRHRIASGEYGAAQRQSHWQTRGVQDSGGSHRSLSQR